MSRLQKSQFLIHCLIHWTDWDRGFGRANARRLLHVANCNRISRLSTAFAKHALAKLPIDKSRRDLSRNSLRAGNEFIPLPDVFSLSP